MACSIEESHESGHALLAYMAGAEVLGAVADSYEGKGHTRLLSLPEDDDADRKLFAQALHIMGGLAGQRLCGFHGKNHERRADADREELSAWYAASAGMKLLECFRSATDFENYMTCTAERILSTHEEAFAVICDRFKARGSIGPMDLDAVGPHVKWMAPGHTEWWQTFLSSFRGLSEALRLHEEVEAAVRQQRAQSAEYQRRLDELRSRHPKPERTTFHRPRVESLL